MTPAQCDRLLDLFLLCKLAKAAWLDTAPINQQNGSTFRELEEVKELADELLEDGVPEIKIVHVLSTHLPTTVFHKHFSAVAA